ncbi:MAG: hypothetical protein ACQKBU_02800, partial [Verrucomicrobiales bacterium]
NATAGQNRRETRQLELFAAGWQTLGKRFAYWSQMDDQERGQARRVLEETLKTAPEDLLEEIDALIEARRSTPS